MMYFLFFGNRCVYEIYFAVGVDVKVKLAPHVSASDLRGGIPTKISVLIKPRIESSLK